MLSVHKVTIEGDMNDADYTSESFSVDLDSQFFGNYIDPYNNIKLTYREFFTAFSQALKQTTHRHNWDCRDEGVQEDILKDTIKILGLDENVVSTDLFFEELWDFLPGTCDYPIHTILSITACPAQDEIVFY